jgi:alpha-ketoglutarate-dependent taurine dioxygenase
LGKADLPVVCDCQMQELAELETIGWARVSNISNRAALLELARSLGRPIMTSTGELLKGLRVTSRSHARPGTLSSAYGSGEFPLHTDTAFWPLPARYLVFRVQGDNRRRTTVLSFADVFQQCSPPALLLAEKAIWLVRTKLGSFYCSLRIQGHCGWRYDGACMFPANPAARELRGLLDSLTASGRGANINWQRDEALVLLNWSVLHGRGPSPEDEKERTLERIYLR